jgi:hypothetical protein
MNFYFYTYYIIIKGVRKISNWDPNPNFSAFIYLSLFVGFNIWSFLLLLAIDGIINNQYAFYSVVPVFIFVPLVNYFVLVRNKKPLTIVKFYDEKYKQRNQSVLGITLVFLYVLLTWFLLFYSMTIFRAA